MALVQFVLPALLGVKPCEKSLIRASAIHKK
jgi:hypothetical protein